ncbi:hypothetical protein ABPG72_015050 [Tetrahymena utriculariae]
MSQIIQQGLSELAILLIAEIKEKAHFKYGHSLDYILELLIYTFVYLSEQQYFRNSQQLQASKQYLTRDSFKGYKLIRLINLILIIAFSILSLVYDNEIKHVFQNILQGVLLVLMLRQYQNLLSFCEALLFTKVCTEFLCLLFAFITHYGYLQDISQVADLFLISSVAIPLISLLVFQFIFKSILIPFGLITIQLGIVVHLVSFNPIKLITLTLQEKNSIFCLVYMVVVTAIGILLSEISKKKIQLIYVRKIFHLQVVLIFTGGVYIAPNLTLMASSGFIWVFFILEFLRQEFSTSILIFNRLDQFVSQFIDEKDSKKLILTHVYLLLGVSYPFIYEYNLLEVHLSSFYEKALSGVLTIGIGDSFAAIIGRSIGQLRIFKYFNSRKTLEGFLAFIGSIILFVKLFNFLIIRDQQNTIVMNDWFYVKVVLVAFIECFTAQVDNLLLPFLLLSL